MQHCLAHCVNPCSSLNGDVRYECGGCAASVVCGPHAADFHPRAAATTQVAVEADGESQPRDASSSTSSSSSKARSSPRPAYNDRKCEMLARAGACATQAADMCRYCGLWCEGDCVESASNRRVALDALRDALSGAAITSLPPLNGTVPSWCGVLEDEDRVRDRGYFVLRDGVPADELLAMQRFVPSLGPPLQYLCGASNVQPEGCRVREFSRAYPRTHARVQAMLDRWVASGFHREARLGWPLEMVGGEFLTTSKWRFPHNVSCFFSALFDEAAAWSGDACMRRCGGSAPTAAAASSEPPAGRSAADRSADRSAVSLTPCWSRCTLDVLVSQLPAARTREVVERVARAPTCANATPYALLDGPFAHVMGADGLLSVMRAWVTRVTNLTLYQGYHDWHMDGPARDGETLEEVGRYHKVFIMVSKSVAPGHRERTNMRLVPNYGARWRLTEDSVSGVRSMRPRFTRPALHGCEGDFCTEAAPSAADVGPRRGSTHSPANERSAPAERFVRGLAWHRRFPSSWDEEREAEELVGGALERGAAEADARDGGGGGGDDVTLDDDDEAVSEAALLENKLIAWGLAPIWLEAERLGCNISLNPGDILFAREDVWHRTQDTDLDRVALKVDVFRFPEPVDRLNPAESGRRDFTVDGGVD